MTADDPGTFVQPWQGTKRFNISTGSARGEAEDGHVGMAEVVCQAGNRVAIDYDTPVAGKSDF